MKPWGDPPSADVVVSGLPCVAEGEMAVLRPGICGVKATLPLDVRGLDKLVTGLEAMYGKGLVMLPTVEGWTAVALPDPS